MKFDLVRFNKGEELLAICRETSKMIQNDKYFDPLNVIGL